MGAVTSPVMRRIGATCWFPLSHSEAIVGDPDLELDVLCDPDEEALARAQEAYGAHRTVTDYREAAQHGAPDLVGIATRTIGRSEIIRHFFEAGTRAFHIEKPLCNSVAELDELAAILSRDDVFVAYGTIRRYFDVYKAARDIACSGRLGALQEIRVGLGAGPLYWTQPHAIDLILFAAGDRKLEGVQARFDTIEPGPRPGDVANDPIVRAASLWFDDGVAGHIGRAPGYDLTLSCEAGEVSVLGDGHTLLLAAATQDNPYLERTIVEDFPRETRPQGIAAPVRQLVACLKGDVDAIAANVIVKRDILIGQRTAFAMVASHRQGSRIVTLADIDPDTNILAISGGKAA